MGLSYTEEIATTLPAARLFTAGITNLLDIAPKLMPDVLLGVDILEGDGGPGSVLLMKYTEEAGGSFKERVDKIDPENFECQYTQFEGRLFGKKLESAVHTMKLLPQPDGGCIYRTTMEVNPLPGVELDDGVMQAFKEQDFGEFRGVEAYLLANPTAYA